MAIPHTVTYSSLFLRDRNSAIHTSQPMQTYSGAKYIIEEKYYGDLDCKTQYRTTKYLNSPGYPLSLRDSPCNIIEQDHRFIKRKVKPMLGFKSLKTAKETISGIEIMHMIRKGQVEEIHDVLSEVEFLNRIMCEVA
jgi:transposase, IS6 family